MVRVSAPRAPRTGVRIKAGQILLTSSLCVLSFYLGNLTSGEIELGNKCPPCKSQGNDVDGDGKSMKTERIPPSMKGITAGLVRTSKLDFAQKYDFGNPYDSAEGKKADVLLLYSNENAMPSDPAVREAGMYGGIGSDGIPFVDTNDATANCDEMNVILMDNPDHEKQCFALVNNYLSYHVQRWMRVGETGPIDHNLPLRAVSRGYTSNGIRAYKSPTEVEIKDNLAMLQLYLNSLDDVLAELKPIAERVAKDNTIIVMTCNFGQAELLMNFACTARARGLDLGNILFFPTDKETKDLAEGLGLTTFFDERNFKSMPSKEAGRYGDKRFVAMMSAKVLCVQLINMLGYNVLFQDVDIVWYKDPLPWFRDDIQKSGDYPWDAYFQDDGAHTVRYAPYSANSGFYYVRSNERTRYLFTSLLYSGDLIRAFDSHQQTLISIINEHSSLFGLRVKVLNRDTPEFPGGWHFHKKNKMFMKSVLNGKVKPYIFHMSWTTNKRNKLKFLQQMGEWRVHDTCVDKEAGKILGADAAGGAIDGMLIQPCCSKEPLIKCHYRDKPSVHPCKDSPPIDKNGKSFW